jgi:hypothetical protein
MQYEPVCFSTADQGGAPIIIDTANWGLHTVIFLDLDSVYSRVCRESGSKFSPPATRLPLRYLPQVLKDKIKNLQWKLEEERVRRQQLEKLLAGNAAHNSSK